MSKKFNEYDLISYAHKEAPTGTRFCQYAKDKIPSWAVDIKVHKDCIKEKDNAIEIIENKRIIKNIVKTQT